MHQVLEQLVAGLVLATHSLAGNVIRKVFTFLFASQCCKNRCAAWCPILQGQQHPAHISHVPCLPLFFIWRL